MREQTVIELGEQYLAELIARGRKFYPIKFEAMKRKSCRTFGRARMTYSGSSYGHKHDIIEINTNMTDVEEIKNTILHELAHLDFEARGDGHGPRWKRVARLYGRWYNTEITRTSSKVIKITGTYLLEVTFTDDCITRYKNVPKKVEIACPTKYNATKKVAKWGKHVESFKLELIK